MSISDMTTEDSTFSHEDQDELEGMLKAMLPTAAAKPSALDFSDLDSLLEDSMTATSKQAEVLRARKALTRGNVFGEERDRLRAIVAKWELEKVWKVVGADARFSVQRCKCGSVHHHFLGFFQKQEHRTSAITRWLAEVDGVRSLEELPKGVQEEYSETPVCIKCAWKQGWGVPV